MKTLVIRLLLMCLFALTPAQVLAQSSRDEVRVAVASNFRAAATDLAARFEALHDLDVVLAFGSTGKHYAQIVNGAPFAVFLAADSERPRRLEQAGIGIAGSRFTYARGHLVLWSADPDLVRENDDVLRSGRFRHLAIANPSLAPYGRAARETLQTLGLWQATEPRLVVGENVAQAFQFVSSRNAELGLVAWSQVVRHGQGSWWRVPGEYHQPVDQQALQLDASNGATTFLEFLRGEHATALIRAHGYGVTDDR